MKKPRYYYSLPLVKTDVIAVESEFLINNCMFNPESIIGVNKSLKPMSRLTICSILDTDDETLSFGAAYCSEKDRFVKATGRAISYERALNNPMRVVSIKGQDVNQVRIQNCKELETLIFNTNPKKF